MRVRDIHARLFFAHPPPPLDFFFFSLLGSLMLTVHDFGLASGEICQGLSEEKSSEVSRFGWQAV